jgi:mono/diheme cytochrome c family protein
MAGRVETPIQWNNRWQLLLLSLLVCIPASQLLADDDAEAVQFDRQVRTIFSNHCYACHGPDANAREGDLRLDLEQSVFSKRDPVTIQPGQASASEIYRRITSDDPDLQMPPPDAKKPLSDEQKATIGHWIDQGAEWESHWAWTAPQPVQVPGARKMRGVINDIDRFILTRLGQAGLKRVQPADPVTLIRRLSFDLLGLPPTPEQVRAFVEESSPDAYDKLVEELLDSPHYGERMAIYWLDVVRYADSNGYHADKSRSISPYRDYVIGSFNNNLPYNQFILEQLAGDLLPEPTVQQKVASGFNMLLQTTDEGGAQAKEYLAKYSADRVRNTSTIFMGVTMGCCECHDHKYDPFTTRDFYQFAAFFADVKEVGVGNATPYPVATPQFQEQLAGLDKQLSEAMQQLETATVELAAAQKAWEAKIAAAATTEASLSAWHIIGPFAAASFEEAHTKQFPPETEIALEKKYGKIGWRKDDKLVDGTIHTLTGENSATYLYRTIQVETATSLPVSLGSDDSLKIWLNGKLVFENKVLRGVLADQDKLRLELTEGENRLLMKVANGGGGYGFYFQHKASTLPAELLAILKTPAGDRNEQQQSQLATYYRSIAPLLKPVRETVARLQQEKKQLNDQMPRSLMTVAVAPRPIRILPRGNWLDETGPVVDPAIPGFLGQLESAERASRLDLANWMISRENPLTARTFVNRLWKMFYGKGLAEPLDDLGNQGTRPSHPALLDYLAIRFMESGWDVKQIVRLMVLSATYRQSSVPTDKLVEQDPLNELFGRQARFRLDAELVRDNALAVSGLLNRTIGGPSVKPYQPAGYWAHMNFPKRSWQASAENQIYRRGLYTHWQRMFLHPSLLAFDAPSREECTVERARSNIPQQALVLLNDPTYVEAARALAVRMLTSSNAAAEDRIEWLFQAVLSRQPTDRELEVLQGVIERQLESYQQDPDAAKQLLAVGRFPVPEELDTVELAAWSSVTRVMLNLHETITRN